MVYFLDFVYMYRFLHYYEFCCVRFSLMCLFQFGIERFFGTGADRNEFKIQVTFGMEWAFCMAFFFLFYFDCSKPVIGTFMPFYLTNIFSDGFAKNYWLSWKMERWVGDSILRSAHNVPFDLYHPIHVTHTIYIWWYVQTVQQINS